VTGLRGTGPVHPGNLTGRLFNEQTRVQQHRRRRGEILDDAVEIMRQLSPAEREQVLDILDNEDGPPLVGVFPNGRTR
jgi:hypothetical protein